MATMIPGGKKEKVEFIQDRRNRMDDLQRSNKNLLIGLVASVVINLVLGAVIIANFNI